LDNATDLRPNLDEDLAKKILVTVGHLGLKRDDAISQESDIDTTHAIFAVTHAPRMAVRHPCLGNQLIRR
jgi:hypothetical protein